MSELLIVGGLTIDRFVDGSSAPGGSVIHSGLAAVAEDAPSVILTVAGDEPEAREGLRLLEGLGVVERQPSAATTTYRHDESSGRRILYYDAASAPIQPVTELPGGPPAVALLAPIADELPAETLRAIRANLRPIRTVFLIQGWLRRLELGQPVHPLPLEAVGDELWDAFAEADAIVLSTEDLAETPDDPFAQAAALRARLGPRPVVVLTLGVQGYLLDDPGETDVVAVMPRRVIEGVPTVGAGDTFGVAFAIHLARGQRPDAAARAATDRVIAVFEARRTT